MEACVEVRGRDINLWKLMTTTKFPKLWNIFITLVTISPMSDRGYSLSGASSYFVGCPELPVTHSEFWDTMMYFLCELNKEYTRKQVLAMKRNKNGR